MQKPKYDRFKASAWTALFSLGTCHELEKRSSQLPHEINAATFCTNVRESEHLTAITGTNCQPQEGNRFASTQTLLQDQGYNSLADVALHAQYPS